MRVVPSHRRWESSEIREWEIERINSERETQKFPYLYVPASIPEFSSYETVWWFEPLLTVHFPVYQKVSRLTILDRHSHCRSALIKLDSRGSL